MSNSIDSDEMYAVCKSLLLNVPSYHVKVNSVDPEQTAKEPFCMHILGS